MKTAIFMVGGPAAGKGFTIKNQFSGIHVVDCDRYKEQHPDFDPKNPNALHAWSKLQADRELATIMATGIDFIYDSTGTNAEKIVNLIQQAQGLGYTTKVVYVTCSLKTALVRNEQRERTVPVEILREKYSTISTSFEIVARYADQVQVINNETN